MATFREKAAHSTDHMFSLYVDYLFANLISRFDFEGYIHVSCSLYTFTFNTKENMRCVVDDI